MVLKNEKIHEVLKTVGHLERLSIKRNFKYKTVACSIRLTKDYESIFKNGGHNICHKQGSDLLFPDV
jgi:hypothetical protein